MFLNGSKDSEKVCESPFHCGFLYDFRQDFTICWKSTKWIKVNRLAVVNRTIG